MQSACSEKARRIVARLDSDERLGDSIRALCAEHAITAACIRAHGQVSAISLRHADGSETSCGPSTVVQCNGTVVDGDSFWLHATISCGSELRAGQVADARVTELEIFLDTIDDVTLHRWSEQQSFSMDAAPDSRPEAAIPPALEWSQVIAASQERAETAANEPATPGSPFPATARHPIAPGDVIEHPRFKRGVVHRVEGDHEFLHVALSNGRVIRLSLEVVTLTPIGIENGQRVFAATV